MVRCTEILLFLFLCVLFVSCEVPDKVPEEVPEKVYQIRAKKFWVPWHRGSMIYFVNKTTYTCYSQIPSGTHVWILLPSCDSLKNIPDIKHFLNPLEEKYEH